MPEPTYTATATSTGDGRNGHVRTSDDQLRVDLAFPTEVGGPGGATNPEQLFAAGWAACFHSALRGIAKGAGTDIADSAVSAAVDLLKGDDGYHLGATFRIDLPGLEDGLAQDLVDRAHAACPYSRATAGNITPTFDVITEPRS